MYKLNFLFLSRNIRSKEDVCLVLDLATIRESEVNPLTQCLYAMQDHKTDNLILLEVDKHILEELNIGNTYVLSQITFMIMCIIEVL